MNPYFYTHNMSECCPSFDPSLAYQAPRQNFQPESHPPFLRSDQISTQLAKHQFDMRARAAKLFHMKMMYLQSLKRYQMALNEASRENFVPQNYPIPYHQEMMNPQYGHQNFKQELPVQRQELPMQKQELPMQKQELPMQKQELPMQKQELPMQKQELPMQKQELPRQKIESPFLKKELFHFKQELKVHKQEEYSPKYEVSSSSKQGDSPKLGDYSFKQEMSSKSESSSSEELLVLSEFPTQPNTGNSKSAPSLSQTTPTESVGVPNHLDFLSEDSIQGAIASERHLKAQVENMVEVILSNMGKKNKEELDKFRSIYKNNKSLLSIFDKLVMKYFSATRCKEDIIRYIMRKAFRVMKTNVSNKEKMCTKRAAALLCKKYFHANYEELQKAGVNIENEDEVVDFFMPYGKKSKNRTMNTNFVVELFKSEEFCQEYQDYLGKFGDYLQEDNKKKKERLVFFVIEAIKSGNIAKIGSFSRLPWLDAWNDETLNIAKSLPLNHQILQCYKKKKLR